MKTAQLLTMLSSKSLGCLESGSVIFGRLFGDIPAPPPFLPVFFGGEISGVFEGVLSLLVMVELVEEELVEGDLERKERSCLNFRSLNKTGMRSWSLSEDERQTQWMTLITHTEQERTRNYLCLPLQ